MLVLSRKKTEAIRIDGGITITVLSVQGNTVRIGIEAPQSVAVRRTELDEISERPAVRRRARCLC